MGCAVSDDKVLTVRQAARIMERSNSHVCTLARQGELDAKKWGKYWFIDPASVRRYMDEVAVKPLPEVLDDPEALEKLYHETGTLRNLATEIGCDRVTVRNALCRHDIEIRTRSQVARKAMKEAPPAPVDMRRWMDVAIIYYQAGLHKVGIRPPAPDEMCPPHCHGRDQCLDGGECIMAGDRTKNGGNHEHKD